MTERIERTRSRLGIPRKEIAEAIGTDRFGWSHKLKQQKSRFSIDEIGLIADYFKAPTGWPWVDWELGETIDRLLAKDRR